MSDFKKFCIDEKLSPIQIVGARKAWQEQQAKIDELQKRVDAALEITKQGIRKQGGDYYLEKLEQALKGGDE